jgi:glutaredoxin
MSRYIVFSKLTCPFCIKAKELLVEQELEHSVVDVGDTWEQLKEAFRWKTVPLVLEAESDMVYHFVGGYTDLVEYLDIEGQDGDAE